MHGAKNVVAANVQDMEVRMVVIRGVGFRGGRGFDLVFFANAHGAGVKFFSTMRCGGGSDLSEGRQAQLDEDTWTPAPFGEKEE